MARSILSAGDFLPPLRCYRGFRLVFRFLYIGLFVIQFPGAFADFPFRAEPARMHNKEEEAADYDYSQEVDEMEHSILLPFSFRYLCAAFTKICALGPEPGKD